MPRRWAIGVLVTAVVIACVGFLLWKANDSRQTVTLRDHSFAVSVMRTPAELRQGLSGTTSLPAGQAMLFVFPAGESANIWMKDMNYAIDIVWLNEHKKIVHIEKNVDPSTYNSEEPEKSEIFRSSTPARYVIELPSGTIEETGISLGDQAQLPSGI